MRCYQCSKIRHYACNCPEKMLIEPRVLKLGALHSMREGRTPNPNGLGGNVVSANIGPSQKGPISQRASMVSNAQQARMFIVIEQERINTLNAIKCIINL